MRLVTYRKQYGSQPARAVWIEILCVRERRKRNGSQPARAVWIEIWGQETKLSGVPTSQPARAVWIEIMFRLMPFKAVWVTACEGCVD